MTTRTNTVKVATLSHEIDHVLVFYPTYSNLAEDVSSQPEYNSFMSIGDISWNEFEDGFPNLMIENIENFRGRGVVFLADFSNMHNIFPQLSGTLYFLK